MKKIITTNGDKIFFGNLVVNKNGEQKEELRKFRDYLMSNFSEVSNVKCTMSDLFQSGIYCGENSTLIKKTPINLFDIDNSKYIEYEEVIYSNKCINSILIFISLLGELDKDKYDKVLSKLFIEEGIFRYDSIDKIWPVCISNIMHSKDMAEYNGKKCADYEALKAAIDEGLITYDIEKTISRKESNFSGVFKGFDNIQLSQIMNNSLILLNNDLCNRELFCKTYKRKK